MCQRTFQDSGTCSPKKLPEWAPEPAVSMAAVTGGQGSPVQYLASQVTLNGVVFSFHFSNRSLTME